MSDSHAEIFERSQDALLESLNLLLKASNRTTEKSEFLKLKAKRDEVMRELNRMELAQINDALLPAEVQDALNKLKDLAGSLVQERERIKKVTEKLQKADAYLEKANEALKLVAKVLAFV